MANAKFCRSWPKSQSELIRGGKRKKRVSFRCAVHSSAAAFHGSDVAFLFVAAARLRSHRLAPLKPLLTDFYGSLCLFVVGSSSGPRSRRVKKADGPRSTPVGKAEEKRPRTAFTAEQLQRLKNEFQVAHHLAIVSPQRFLIVFANVPIFFRWREVGKSWEKPSKTQ